MSRVNSSVIAVRDAPAERAKATKVRNVWSLPNVYVYER